MGGTVSTGCGAVGVGWTCGEGAGVVSRDRVEVCGALPAGAAGVNRGVLVVDWARSDGVALGALLEGVAVAV